jgi:NAD(P)H-hydrate epimerase
MRSLFNFREIRETENKIINEIVPSLILMENAGRHAAEIILHIFPEPEDYEIYIITGKGNNAGDGFVIARHLLTGGYRVNLIMLADASELKGDARINHDVLIKLNFPNLTFCNIDSLHANCKILIIDAILGTGITGKPDEKFATAIRRINGLKNINSNLKVVSVDIPSGLYESCNYSDVIKADYTITMGALKSELLFGEAKEAAGKIFIADIGVGSEIFNTYNIYGKYVAEPVDIKAAFPRRKKHSYKYSNGKALIIGGSKGFSGAMIMSCISSLKAGAGAVFAAYPDCISAHFGRKLYEAIKTELESTAEGTISPDSLDSVKKLWSKADAVLIGPGISVHPATKSFIREVILKCPVTLVADADALTVLSEEPDLLLRRNNNSEIILTPHLGEFSRLSGYKIDEIKKNRLNIAVDFARRYNVNLILKSETSVSVTREGKLYVNMTGSEVLATAGSGDVLSGIVVSLLAQGCNVLNAMICANYIHGMTGLLYFKKRGNKQTAMQRDLIELIPEAITETIA